MIKSSLFKTTIGIKKILTKKMILFFYYKAGGDKNKRQPEKKTKKGRLAVPFSLIAYLQNFST